jgi:hypothetical protein
MATLIFIIFYAPEDSHLIINGLTSSDHPASWQRFGAVIMYYGKELVSIKWTGLWIALLLCLAVSWKRSFRRELWIFPVVLGLYVVVFTATYTINTFYEIVWWLDTSLNRIIFALIPVTAFWAFLGIGKK